MYGTSTFNPSIIIGAQRSQLYLFDTRIGNALSKGVELQECDAQIVQCSLFNNDRAIDLLSTNLSLSVNNIVVPTTSLPVSNTVDMFVNRNCTVIGCENTIVSDPFPEQNTSPATNGKVKCSTAIVAGNAVNGECQVPWECDYYAVASNAVGVSSLPNIILLK